jgi:hypothetical protein
VDNAFAPLFEPNQQEATRRVLVGEARPEEFQRIRERLGRWPTIRRDVEENLSAFEKNYTPFAKGLDMLRGRMPLEDWRKLAATHRARVRNWFRLDTFVASVRSSMLAFEQGLQAVRDGRMSVEGLGRLHAEMVDGYHIS